MVAVATITHGATCDEIRRPSPIRAIAPIDRPVDARIAAFLETAAPASARSCRTATR
jgi:hypothetical protein